MQPFRILLFFGFLVLLTASCQEQINFFATDYSDVPPLPDTANAISRTVTLNGITVYVTQEGDPDGFAVTIRDNIDAFFTVYSAETGQILQSTYANGVTSAQRIPNVGNQAAVNFIGANLYEGISGMRAGERRVLLYPDSLTDRDIPMIVDFELDEVLY